MAPPRLAALLLVAALLPAVVAAWSVGPLTRVQTALVEASRSPAPIEVTPARVSPHETTPGCDDACPTPPAPLERAVCTALFAGLELSGTPPPAIA